MRIGRMLCNVFLRMLNVLHPVALRCRGAKFAEATALEFEAATARARFVTAGFRVVDGPRLCVFGRGQRPGSGQGSGAIEHGEGGVDADGGGRFGNGEDGAEGGQGLGGDGIGLVLVEECLIGAGLFEGAVEFGFVEPVEYCVAVDAGFEGGGEDCGSGGDEGQDLELGSVQGARRGHLDYLRFQQSTWAGGI